MKLIRVSIIAALATACVAAVPATAATPFVPIHHRYLRLPASLQPWGASWMPDNHHVLFENEVDYKLWSIRDDGTGLECVSCQIDDFPAIPGTVGEFAYAFGDGKRLFVSEDTATLASDPPQRANGDIIECAPSILRCTHHVTLPVDMSADEQQPEPILERRTWHLAPDGKHLAWMDVRPDGTLLVVGRLQRESDRYRVVDLRVVNPAGPTGPTDTDPSHWASAGEIFELKSFVNGGRDVLIVGEPDAINPDQEVVNLATGKVTRITANPDWDEDGGFSPDGQLDVDASFRTMHGTDALGAILPEIHPFIDLPVTAGAAGYYVSSHDGFQCDLTPWLLPSSGDDDAKLVGQPLGPYAGGPSYVANDFFGSAIWSPDSRRVLLVERIYGPAHGTTQEAQMGSAPHRIAIAELDRRPGPPQSVVDSTVGAWAPTVAGYNTGFAEPGVVTVNGAGGGSATLTYAGNLLDGEDSATYHHYSDDGTSFADGTETVDNPAFLASSVKWKADIAITGAHTGSLHADVAFNGPTKTTGSVTSMLDGVKLTGPPKLGACPTRMPHPTPLRLHVSSRRGRLRALVTASIAGAGPTEQARDTRPVQRAVVRVGRRRARTNASGIAVLRLPASARGRRTRVRATAGDTFVRASRRVRLQ